MLLEDKLKNTGLFLFKWRSYLPLILVIPLFIELRNFTLFFNSQVIDTAYEMFCFVLSFLGEMIRVLSIGFISQGTSGRNTDAHVASALNTTGMYSLTRNPLYMGNYGIFLGVILISQSWEYVLLNSVIFLLFYIPIIMSEEKYLLEKFGGEYKEYSARVPCIIPCFSCWRRPQKRMNWKMVMCREHDTALAVVGLYFLIVHIRGYFVAGTLRLELIWVIIGATGLCIWSTLKIMKKYTQLLHSPS